MGSVKTDITLVYLGLWFVLLASCSGPSTSDIKEIAAAVKAVQADLKRAEATCKK